LTTGTTNPTRYQLLIPRYSSAEQFADVFATLDRRQTPVVVVVLAPWVPWPKDPMNPYVAARYDRMPVPFKGRPIPAFMVFERRRTSSG